MDEPDTVLFRVFPGSVVSAVVGSPGSGSRVRWFSLRTIFSRLWAKAAIYLSQSTFHNPHSQGRAHPSRSRDAKVHSAIVRLRKRSR